MSFYCHNRLAITVPAGRDESRGVLNLLIGPPNDEPPDLTFSRSDPPPCDLTEKALEAWKQSWWGTPDEPTRTRLLQWTDQVVIAFDTSEAPPLGWVSTLSQNNPTWTVTLAYYTPATGYAGALAAQDGKVTLQRPHRDPGDTEKFLGIWGIDATPDSK